MPTARVASRQAAVVATLSTNLPQKVRRYGQTNRVGGDRARPRQLGNVLRPRRPAQWPTSSVHWTSPARPADATSRPPP
eukprot:scaffold227759_cov29-Prasinocladus_malaysianus.AAC.3